MKKILPRRISKYSGAGNTFLITTRNQRALPNSQKIQKICKKVKTDGLLLLEKTARARWTWHFYNEDGSTAEMCGNALRCVGKYCTDELKGPNRIQVKTGSGPVFCQKKGSRYLAQMPRVGKVRWLSKLSGFSVNTGVPHFVIQTQMTSFLEIKKNKTWLQKIRKIRWDKKTFPRGTNVTLLLKSSKKKAITFERGVEDFTPACGTGAVAAAAVHFLKDHKKKQIIEMPGGKLTVLLGAKTILSGPTRKIRSYSEKEIQL